MRFIKDFKEISGKDILFAGGKGANLGELVKIGMPVPEGFVISAQAFEKFLEETDIVVESKAVWERINIKDTESVEEASEILRDLILKKEFPRDLGKEILKAFDSLGAKFVAVRSSATAEDSKIDSWAGELETYLNTTRENLLENIKKCWASLFSPRAIFYRFERGLNHKPVLVAVVVQKMVQSDVSGVCFTVHPVTKAKNQMVVEACWGLGEILVQGAITPDTYVVEKPEDKELKILDINVNPQRKMIVRAKEGNKTIAVPKEKIKRQKLSENQIKELAKLCLRIENHFKDPRTRALGSVRGTPQDIEWALERDKFYILQTRPITAL